MTVLALAQLIGDILQSYMGLDSQHVVLYDENWDAKKNQDLYVLVIPDGGPTIAINSEINSATGVETMGRASHERFAIEVVSRSRLATERYPEVWLALQSVAATQLAEVNSVSFFRDGDPLDLSAIEGAGALRRYRIPIIVSNVQKKSAAASMIDKFSAPTIKTEA